ncbi:MAG TPA: hypothetical protein VHZ55_12455 [Bryobacteraceae bacterium]|nr:hypothetical protein [Bryobacteraceae bacterium]
MVRLSSGWEEYLEILDAFYSDHVEVSDDTETGTISGAVRVRTLLFKFLVPLHAMAETSGLSIQIRESPIHGDTVDETHSAWSVDLTSVRQDVQTDVVHSSTMGQLPRGVRMPLRPSPDRRAPDWRRSWPESVTGKLWRSTAVLAAGNFILLRNQHRIQGRNVMPTTAVSATLKWDVLVTNRQGLTRDLPPGKEQWTWVPTSATLWREALAVVQLHRAPQDQKLCR